MQIRGRRLALSCIASALVAVACAQNSLGDPTGSVCPSGSTLSYENFGKAFFATNCNSCHGSQQFPHFSTQEEIQSASSEVDRAAAAGPNNTNTYMPQDSDVSDSERKKLGEWLACGAP